MSAPSGAGSSSAATSGAGLLRALQRPGAPLVLPNAWDVASARLVEAAGFPVVATSSAAMLASLGHPDDGSAPPDEVFAAVRRIARGVSVPVTADIEDGYGLPAPELAQRLLDAGAAGCNIEDGNHAAPGSLIAADRQADRIAAIRQALDAAGADLVINARIDTYAGWSGQPEARVEETLRRAALYAAAGADSVYPIFMPMTDAATFLQSVRAPVNLLSRPDPEAIAAVAALGVVRISMGPLLARIATAAVTEALGAIAPAAPD